MPATFLYHPARIALLAVLLMLPAALLHAAEKQASEKIIIQLKWLHQFQFAGYYAALEQGYFADEGLDVELRERDMARNNVEQVLTGEAHYGIADSILLQHYVRGQDVVLVAPIFQHSPNVLMTLRSSGIRSPRDLVGRRLAFYDNDTDGIAILAMLAAQGVLRDGLIRQPWTDRLEKLISGETEAVAAYSTNEPFQLREMGYQVDVIDPKHYGMDFYGDIFFTHAAEARDHPDRVEAMRRAVIRGWHYALDHKEEMVELILRRYNTQQKSHSALMSEALGLEPLIARHTVELGTLDEGRLQYMLEQLSKHQILKPSGRGVDALVFQTRRVNELQLTEEEEAFLQSLPPIRVGVDNNWPPFEFIDRRNQSLQGVVGDYLLLFSKRLGVEFDIQYQLSWIDALHEVSQGRLDLLTAVAPTPERHQFLNFTQPYVRSPMVIVTGTDVDFIASMDQLQGKKLGVGQSYASHEMLRNNFPLLPLELKQSTLDGLKAVASGELYAFIDNLAVVSYLMRSEGLANLKVSGQTPFSFDISMGVRNDSPLLLSVMEKALASISPAEHAEIYDRWVQVPSSVGFPWARVLPVLLGLLFLLLLLALYTLRLAQLNSRIRSFNQRLQDAEKQLLEKNAQLEQLSITDKLTGVYNRHHLDRVLLEQLAVSRRHQRPLAVVLFDLDYFKELNDTHGHQMGDRVLQAFAQLVKNTVRISDVFGRWGGEEFLLICPETTLQQAISVADKIRSKLEQYEFEGGVRQRVSAGVMALSEGMTVDQLLSAVDKQLYIAKESGRNQVMG